MAPPALMDREITIRHLVVMFGLLTAVIGVYTFFHSKLLMPEFYRLTVETVRAEISKHEQRPHPSSPSKEDMALVRQDMRDLILRTDKLATKSDVDHLTERIRMLEQRVGTLADKR